GVIQHGMGFEEAAHNYILLTIGDGLVAQVPSLILSTAAAIMVTRVSSSQNMGNAVLHQVFGSIRSLTITAAVLGLIGIIPGMPHIAFLMLAAGLGGMAWLLFRKNRVKKQDDSAEQATQLLQAQAPA